MAYTNVTLWSFATPVAIYVRLIGSVQSGPIAGVKSCSITRIDDYYDTDVYRDTSDLSPTFVAASPGSNLSDAAYLGSSTASVLLLSSTIATSGAVSIQATATSPAVTGTSAYMSVDDRASHIPPRDVKKSRSLIQFWNDVTPGSGAAVAAAWADEYMGMSIAEFDTIQ